MPRGSHSIEICADCQTVFDLIHDYQIRLDWDPMLSRASLLDGATRAAKDVRSRCVGNWKSLWLPIESTYVSYKSGQVAAVRMVNRPWFFKSFAATIRHDPIVGASIQQSQVAYIYRFQAKPNWLAFLLEPIMKAALDREVKMRLKALKAFAESKTNEQTSDSKSVDSSQMVAVN